MVFIPVVGSKTEKLEIVLDKEKPQDRLLVVFVGRGEDEIDLDLSFVHKSPSTEGKIVIRGVLKDNAFARVKGLIKIEKGAQKSQNFLEERTLLLGKNAQIEAYPYLEIEADDVRASHAATAGVVDKEQLFYLQSRGVSEDQAFSLIVEGFLSRILEEVAPDDVKQVASQLEKVKEYALD